MYNPIINALILTSSICTALSLPSLSTRSVAASGAGAADPCDPSFQFGSELSSQVFNKNLTIEVGGGSATSGVAASWPADSKRVDIFVRYTYQRETIPYACGAIPLVEVSAALINPTKSASSLVTTTSWKEGAQKGDHITGVLSLAFDVSNEGGEVATSYKLDWTDNFYIGKDGAPWAEQVTQLSGTAAECEVGICGPKVLRLKSRDLKFTVSPLKDCAPGTKNCPK